MPSNDDNQNVFNSTVSESLEGLKSCSLYQYEILAEFNVLPRPLSTADSFELYKDTFSTTISHNFDLDLPHFEMIQNIS